jgi:serine/threonine protein kinase
MLDYHENEFKAWLVLEHAGYLTLEKYVKNGTPLPLIQIKTLVTRLLHAVSFLHEN